MMKLLLYLFALFAFCLVNVKFVTAQNTKDYKVVVRSYFNNTDMDMNKAGIINSKFRQKLGQNGGGGNPPNRNLRADRELQTTWWCGYYCPRIGCSWCKINDSIFGQDCNRACRRREEEAEEQQHDRELQTDGMTASFVSDRKKFTSQQNAICNAMIDAMVRDNDDQ
jgi:hypothetical protein